MSLSLSHVITKNDELNNLRKKIEEDKPKPTDMKILNPSDDSDWKMIKYYNRVRSNSRILISCFKCRGVVFKGLLSRLHRVSGNTPSRCLP